MKREVLRAYGSSTLFQDAIQTAAASGADQVAEFEAELRSANSEAAAVRGRRDRYLRMFESGDLDTDLFQFRVRALADQLNELEQTAERLRESIQLGVPALPAPADVAVVEEVAHEIFEAEVTPAVKAVVRCLVDEIRLARGRKASIVLRVPQAPDRADPRVIRSVSEISGSAIRADKHLVVGTGVDPVTSRFSGARSAN